jgi:hypothetical protein
MALFSDIDWMIIVVVGAFLLLGRESGALLRQVGRYYGRFVRLKQELLGELTRAADLPSPRGGNVLSFRGALLGYADGSQTPGIPVAVTTPPIAAYASVAASTSTIGPDRWSVASPGAGLEGPGIR